MAKLNKKEAESNRIEDLEWVKHVNRDKNTMTIVIDGVTFNLNCGFDTINTIHMLTGGEGELSIIRRFLAYKHSIVDLVNVIHTAIEDKDTRYDRTQFGDFIYKQPDYLNLHVLGAAVLTLAMHEEKDEEEAEDGGKPLEEQPQQ